MEKDNGKRKIRKEGGTCEVYGENGPKSNKYL